MVEYVIRDNEGTYHYLEIKENEFGKLIFDKDLQIANDDIDLISEHYMTCSKESEPLEDFVGISPFISLFHYVNFISFLFIIGEL